MNHVFYNTSKYTFKKLLNDPSNIRQNLENYLDGFSSDVQDIISKFKLRNQLDTMEEGNITFPLIEKFCSSQINLSPEPVKDKDGKITQKFAEQKFKPWELNAQFNYLREGHLGSAFFTAGYKLFQNNSALADLMTSVDYNQYLQFPGIDTLNAAILETNKAFIGKYKEFVTNNINVQLVLSLPDKKKDGGEKLITPGISIRFEKNTGDFSAVNWRFGLPLRFKGKEKAVNIEPQVRLNNTNNYSNKPNYKIQPTFGLNAGLPFTVLFK